jgi:hypothetical protein
VVRARPLTGIRVDSFLTHSGDRYWWCALSSAAEFVVPVRDSPFSLLLWDVAGGWSASERVRLANALLDAGCRYAVCGGVDCEVWHDTIDWAFVDREIANNHAARLVMTTGHTDEPIEDVVQFFVLHARLPGEDLREHLVVQIGQDWDIENDLQLWVRGWVQHPFGVDQPDTAG